MLSKNSKFKSLVKHSRRTHTLTVLFAVSCVLLYVALFEEPSTNSNYNAKRWVWPVVCILAAKNEITRVQNGVEIIFFCYDQEAVHLWNKSTLFIGKYRNKDSFLLYTSSTEANDKLRSYAKLLKFNIFYFKFRQQWVICMMSLQLNFSPVFYCFGADLSTTKAAADGSCRHRLRKMFRCEDIFIWL